MWKGFSSSWSPWISGAILAILFLFGLYVLNAPFGTKEAYTLLIDKANAAINKQTIKLDWETIFLIGIFCGAFVAAIIGKDFKIQLVPDDHLSKGPIFYLFFGPVLLFIGGFLVMAGLILAGNTFLKMWYDFLAMYIVAGLFLLTVFIEAVIIGTLFSIRIEGK